MNAVRVMIAYIRTPQLVTCGTYLTRRWWLHTNIGRKTSRIGQTIIIVLATLVANHNLYVTRCGSVRARCRCQQSIRPFSQQTEHRTLTTSDTSTGGWTDFFGWLSIDGGTSNKSSKIGKTIVIVFALLGSTFYFVDNGSCPELCNRA